MAPTLQYVSIERGTAFSNSAGVQPGLSSLLYASLLFTLFK
jgi:hypothetical protein